MLKTREAKGRSQWAKKKSSAIFDLTRFMQQVLQMKWQNMLVHVH